MNNPNALSVFTQLFVLALVVERIIQVFQLLFTREKDPTLETPMWGRSQISAAAVLSFFALIMAKYDFIGMLFVGKNLADPFQYVGYVAGAIICGGGSDGLRRILDAISAAAKASKEQSKTNIVRAKAEREALKAR